MNKVFKTLIWPVMAIPLAYLAIEWNTLPEKVAIHYNLTGTADKFGSKNQLLIMALILTAVNIGAYLLLRNVYRIDRRKYATVNKTRLDKIGFAISAFMAAVLCFIIYNSTQVDKKFSTQFIFAGVGLLFAFIGNYIHNIKPNYFAGIRLPWTLNNEDNWRKTHLLGGKLFFAGGILITVICLFAPATISVIAFFSITATIVILPCLYSYRLHKRQN
ncbi:MAG: SdpI family protein [Chitinophagaceae bacterium]